MNRVDVESNWGYWDRLDGARLKNGERARVRWPDGTETVETVRVEEDTFEYEDMGHPGEGPNDRAYIEIWTHAHPGRVYLRGSELLLEREVPQ